MSAVMSIADGRICSGRGVLHCLYKRKAPRAVIADESASASVAWVLICIEGGKRLSLSTAAGSAPKPTRLLPTRSDLKVRVGCFQKPRRFVRWGFFVMDSHGSPP